MFFIGKNQGEISLPEGQQFSLFVDNCALTQDAVVLMFKLVAVERRVAISCQRENAEGKSRRAIAPGDNDLPGNIVCSLHIYPAFFNGTELFDIHRVASFAEGKIINHQSNYLISICISSFPVKLENRSR